MYQSVARCIYESHHSEFRMLGTLISGIAQPKKNPESKKKHSEAMKVEKALNEHTEECDSATLEPHKDH